MDALAGSPDDPELDLTAVYAKNRHDELDFRLEMLDVPFVQQADIYLLLDLYPGSPNSIQNRPITLEGADVIAHFSADGLHRAWYAQQGDPLPQPQLRIQRNPVLDLIDLHIAVREPVFLPARVRMQVLITSPGDTIPADLSPEFSLKGQPPPPADVFFAFWDTFPAHTPAQALRSWDGAHSGPFGERHGLSPLLDNFRQFQIPVLLADILEPGALSGLDYLGGLGKLQRLSEDSPLMLSSSLPPLPAFLADPRQTASAILAENKLAAQAAGLQHCPCYYLPDANGLPYFNSQTGLLLTHRQPSGGQDPYLQLIRRGQQKIVLLPETPLQALDRSGLTAAGRRAVLQTALASTGSGRAPAILALGGSLPLSGWGDPGAAHSALEYLVVRPWIKYLSVSDLAGRRPADADSLSDFSAAFASTDSSSRSLSLAGLSPGAAWSAGRALLQPPLPQIADWVSMQNAYRWVPALLAWVESQTASEPHNENCSLLVSGLPEPLCVLANHNMLAVIDPHQTGLLYLGIWRAGNNAYAQIIGPSAQLVVGLSDPARWQPEAGPFADPAVYPGGFSTGDPLQDFQSGEAQLILFYPQYTIAYQLLDLGLEVHLRCRQTAGCQIPALDVPLVLTPQTRFDQDWAETYGYAFSANGSMLNIGWFDGLRVQVHSTTALQLASFSDSPAPQNRRENPDRDYPAGHFLPLGFSLLEISPPTGQDLLVRLQVTHLSGP